MKPQVQFFEEVIIYDEYHDWLSVARQLEANRGKWAYIGRVHTHTARLIKAAEYTEFLPEELHEMWVHGRPKPNFRPRRKAYFDRHFEMFIEKHYFPHTHEDERFVSLFMRAI